MTQQLLIKVVLILGVVAFVIRLFRYNGDRSQAMRRIGLVLFAVVAVISILVPDLWNAVARFVGVGRGADIVLYALVIAFLTFTVTTYLRFRNLETAYTRLARRIALDEAERRLTDRGGTDPQPLERPDPTHTDESGPAPPRL